MPRLVIYQPDIPQNTGTMLRMAACLGLPVEIVEPAGFDVSDRHLRRSGLDYLDHAGHDRDDEQHGEREAHRPEIEREEAAHRRGRHPPLVEPGEGFDAALEPIDEHAVGGDRALTDGAVEPLR